MFSSIILQNDVDYDKKLQNTDSLGLYGDQLRYLLTKDNSNNRNDIPACIVLSDQKNPNCTVPFKQ